MWTLGGGGMGHMGQEHERPTRASDKQGVGALVGPVGTVTVGHGHLLWDRNKEI